MDRTPGGALLSSLKEAERKAQGLVGSKIRLVEQAGRQLRRLLCTNDPWRRRGCEKEMCSTCRGPPKMVGLCYKRNVVYQDICLPCMVGKRISRYIGESSRSLYERGVEQRTDARDHKDLSHIRSHVEEVHPEMLDNLLDLFRMEPIKFHRTAMERLVMEAMLVNR